MSAGVDDVAPDRQLAVAGLLVGLALLAGGLAVGFESSVVGGVFGMERAWVEGGIALPMLVLAPGALSLGWADEGIVPVAKWLSRAIAVGIVVGIVGLTAATTAQIGCEPVTNPIQTLPKGLVLAGVTAGGFLAAVAAGRWFATSERPRSAVLAGLAVALLSAAVVVVTLAALNQGVSCARGPV